MDPFRKGVVAPNFSSTVHIGIWQKGESLTHTPRGKHSLHTMVCSRTIPLEGLPNWGSCLPRGLTGFFKNPFYKGGERGYTTGGGNGVFLCLGGPITKFGDRGDTPRVLVKKSR